MERPDQSPISKRVVWLVLGYLCLHPDAKDTAEGITTWWLRVQGTKVDIIEVRDVLSDLVARGWLTVTGSQSNYHIYGLHPARKRDLRQLFGNSR